MYMNTYILWMNTHILKYIYMRLWNTFIQRPWWIKRGHLQLVNLGKNPPLARKITGFWGSYLIRLKVCDDKGKIFRITGNYGVTLKFRKRFCNFLWCPKLHWKFFLQRINTKYMCVLCTGVSYVLATNTVFYFT